MRPVMLGLSMVLFVLLCSAPTSAIAGQDRDIARQQLLSFDRFLDSHPMIDQDLRNDPSLFNNSQYISSHPELRKFLEDHRGVREEIRKNPRFFNRRDHELDKSARENPKVLKREKKYEKEELKAEKRERKAAEKEAKRLGRLSRR